MKAEAHAHIHLKAAWPFAVQMRDGDGHEYMAIQARAIVSLNRVTDAGTERMTARDCDTYIYIPAEFAEQLATDILQQLAATRQEGRVRIV